MSVRFRSTCTAVLSLALVGVATPARAQELATAAAAPAVALALTARAPAAAAAPASVTTPAGPTLDAAAIGVHRSADVAAVAPARHGASGPGVALMIVGGAAILVGIVVGNDAGHAISIGGAVVGLVGLYQYLQ
jgi:hypothetical protein